ncbi:MAG: Na/Pi cotransporter family protein [Clostridiales bacterium]|nr:Na/Pi cotransporter family protein [Clostridiales bacterium]
MELLDIFTLLGGVGLFLYGMTQMSSGLKAAAGDNLRIILQKATSNRFTSVMVGILVTLMIQSSSATDVMVIGFVNAGMMTLTQAIGVIMGANIGTTVTAQLTAFNLSSYAPLILFVGAVMYLFLKNGTVKSIGSVILGFGMLFEGIALMKSAIAPLAESEAFVNMLSGLSNPFLAVLFGIAFTALLQSSSSSIVIFQAFASTGILSYEVAVYLILGAAVGSVTPNLLAALTANRSGKRCAILNLLFNVVRCVVIGVIITLFPQVLRLIQSLSPNDVARQIANTHTIFAIFAVIIELPLTNTIVRVAERIIPLKEEETRKAKDQRLVYLSALDSLPAAVSLNQAKLEIYRMGEFALNNLRTAIDYFFDNDESKIQQVLDQEDTVDYLDHNITQALIDLRYHHLPPRDLNRLGRLLLDVSDIERISDHAVNLTEYRQKLNQRKGTLTKEALDDLHIIADATLASVEYSLQLFRDDRFDDLPEAEALEHIVNESEDMCISNHVGRMMEAECDPMGGVVYSDMVMDLERCSDHAISVAYSLSGQDS